MTNVVLPSNDVENLEKTMFGFETQEAKLKRLNMEFLERQFGPTAESQTEAPINVEKAMFQNFNHQIKQVETKLSNLLDSVDGVLSQEQFGVVRGLLLEVMQYIDYNSRETSDGSKEDSPIRLDLIARSRPILRQLLILELTGDASVLSQGPDDQISVLQAEISSIRDDINHPQYQLLVTLNELFPEAEGSIAYHFKEIPKAELNEFAAEEVPVVHLSLDLFDKAHLEKVPQLSEFSDIIDQNLENIFLYGGQTAIDQLFYLLDPDAVILRKFSGSTDSADYIPDLKRSLITQFVTIEIDGVTFGNGDFAVNIDENITVSLDIQKVRQKTQTDQIGQGKPYDAIAAMALMGEPGKLKELVLSNGAEAKIVATTF